MLRSYLRLLRSNRNYRLLWLAQVISETGDWFYSLAVYYLLLDLSRKRVMILSDIGRFLIVLGMLVVRTPAMVWLVYPLLFLETIGAAFFEPAHSAVIPNIVP